MVGAKAEYSPLIALHAQRGASVDEHPMRLARAYQCAPEAAIIHATFAVDHHSAGDVRTEPRFGGKQRRPVERFRRDVSRRKRLRVVLQPLQISIAESGVDDAVEAQAWIDAARRPHPLDESGILAQRGSAEIK